VSSCFWQLAGGLVAFPCLGGRQVGGGWSEHDTGAIEPVRDRGNGRSKGAGDRVDVLPLRLLSACRACFRSWSVENGDERQLADRQLGFPAVNPHADEPVRRAGNCRGRARSAARRVEP